jgi:hypothetical protein
MKDDNYKEFKLKSEKIIKKANLNRLSKPAVAKPNQMTDV